MNRKLIAAISLIIAVCIGLYFYAEWEKARFDASLPQLPAVEEQQVSEDTGGHWHDGEWHADDAHENDTGETELIPSVDWQPSTGRPHEVVKPEGLDELDADDPVAKAWAKLDYIADNPFAWGGNADPGTAALVQQLMPPRSIVHHDDGYELSLLLNELARLRDPRSIETMLAYQCGDDITIGAINEALVAIGPPSVPYLIRYLDEDYGDLSVPGVHTAAKVLGRIGAQHVAELDGIVAYIILPKLERLIATGSISNWYPVKITVEEAIAHLKSTRPQ